jgi:hypothetical protein
MLHQRTAELMKRLLEQPSFKSNDALKIIHLERSCYVSVLKVEHGNETVMNLSLKIGADKDLTITLKRGEYEEIGKELRQCYLRSANVLIPDDAAAQLYEKIHSSLELELDFFFGEKKKQNKKQNKLVRAVEAPIQRVPANPVQVSGPGPRHIHRRMQGGFHSHQVQQPMMGPGMGFGGMVGMMMPTVSMMPVMQMQPMQMQPMQMQPMMQPMMQTTQHYHEHEAEQFTVL